MEVEVYICRIVFFQMLKKSIYLILCALCVSAPIMAEDMQSGEYTIERCYDLSRENYPLVKQYDLIGITETYTLKNATMHYYPQIALNAQATYQTDKNVFPEINGAETPQYYNDHYNAQLEISQIIWDGGEIKAEKKNIRAKADIEREEYQVNMYKLRESINNLFFGILLIREQMSQVDILIETLQMNYDKVASCVSNGVANQNDLDIIGVELISGKQKRVQLETLIDAYLRMLSLMLGEDIESSDKLVKPIPEEMSNAMVLNSLISGQISRPELGVFDARQKEISTQWDKWAASGLPQIRLFVKGSYGRPGLNIFEDKFTPYAWAGISLRWNLSELYSLGFGKQVIASAKHQVENGRQTFLFNTNLQTEEQAAKIRRYYKIMEDDDDVIALRERVRKATEVEVMNGTKSTSDLITEMNKEQAARQEKVVHEIELIKAIYELKTIKND